MTVTSCGQMVTPAHDRRRPIGLLRGRIAMAEDFGATPAVLVAAMEGEDPAAGG